MKKLEYEIAMKRIENIEIRKTTTIDSLANLLNEKEIQEKLNPTSSPLGSVTITSTTTFIPTTYMPVAGYYGSTLSTLDQQIEVLTKTLEILNNMEVAKYKTMKK